MATLPAEQGKRQAIFHHNGVDLDGENPMANTTNHRWMEVAVGPGNWTAPYGFEWEPIHVRPGDIYAISGFAQITAIGGDHGAIPAYFRVFVNNQARSYIAEVSVYSTNCFETWCYGKTVFAVPENVRYIGVGLYTRNSRSTSAPEPGHTDWKSINVLFANVRFERASLATVDNCLVGPLPGLKKNTERCAPYANATLFGEDFTTMAAWRGKIEGKSSTNGAAIVTGSMCRGGRGSCLRFSGCGSSGDVFSLAAFECTAARPCQVEYWYKGPVVQGFSEAFPGSHTWTAIPSEYSQGDGSGVHTSPSLTVSSWTKVIYLFPKPGMASIQPRPAQICTTRSVDATIFYTLPDPSNNFARNNPTGKHGGCLRAEQEGLWESKVEWNRLKIDLSTLQVDVTDHTFATQLSGTTLLDFGGAAGCNYTELGEVVIDLRGTPFAVAGESSCDCKATSVRDVLDKYGPVNCRCSQWELVAWRGTMSVECVDNNQRCTVRCGGSSGKCSVIGSKLQLEVLYPQQLETDCFVSVTPTVIEQPLQTVHFMAEAFPSSCSDGYLDDIRIVRIIDPLITTIDVGLVNNLDGEMSGSGSSGNDAESQDSTNTSSAGSIAAAVTAVLVVGLIGVCFVRRRRTEQAKRDLDVKHMKEDVGEDGRHNTFAMEENPMIAQNKKNTPTTTSVCNPMFSGKNAGTQHQGPTALYTEPDPTQPGVYDSAKENAPSVAPDGAAYDMPSTDASKAPIYAEYSPGMEPNGAVYDMPSAAPTDLEYLDVDDSSFTSQPWYVAKLDKAACKARVFESPIGGFLVRESKNHSGSYAVCVKIGDGQVQEDLVERDPILGVYTIKFCKDQSFPNLMSLVQHCQTHSIAPKRGTTLKLQQPAGVVYADPCSVAVGVSAADSMYGCLYGQVDSGLLNFFNRIVLSEAEIYDSLAVSPLGTTTDVQLVSLTIALKSAETHCRCLDFAFDHAKRFAAKHSAKLILLFPKMTARSIEIIVMYTADSDLYRKMNASFGGYGKPKGRAMSVHYRQYAQLLISALQCLPDVGQRIVYRGVLMSYTELLNGKTVGDTITWWPFTSTTGSSSILRKKEFFDAVVNVNKATGKIINVVQNNQNVYDAPNNVAKTIFVIMTLAGCSYHIVSFSAFEDEDEYLLLPGSTFKIEGIGFWRNGITEVRLRQVASPYSLVNKDASKSASRGKLPDRAAGQLTYGDINAYLAPDANEEVIYEYGGGGGAASNA
jgi:hypothetical protein